VVTSGGLYGIERMLLSLLPALGASGVPVALACLNRPGGAGSETGEAAAAQGVPVHFLDPGRSRGLALIPRLAALARTLRAPALHAHGYKTPILAGAAGRLAGIPVVGTAHSEALRAPHLRRYVRVEAWFLRRFRALVAVSNGVREDLEHRGVPTRRIHVIPNGIPDPLAGGEADGRTGANANTVVYIGRLSPEKNLDVLLEAAALLCARGLPLQLLLAGDGPERARLAAHARRPPLDGVVRLLGFQSDTRAVLSQGAAFVLPSQTEGVPMALLEATAAGVPIVASAVGGIPSVVEDGRTALLVPPGDVEALAGALGRVLTDTALATSLRTAARRRYLAEFTVGTMAGRYAAFYDEVLPER